MPIEMAAGFALGVIVGFAVLVIIIVLGDLASVHPRSKVR